MSAPGVKSNCNTMVLNPLLARALGGPGSEHSLAGCKSNASGARISMLERCKNVYKMKLEKLKSRMLVYKTKSRKKTWGLPPTAVNKNKNKTKKFPDELADLNSSARLAPREVLAGVSRVVGAASGGRLAAVRTLATVCSGSTNVNERKQNLLAGESPPGMLLLMAMRISACVATESGCGIIPMWLLSKSTALEARRILLEWGRCGSVLLAKMGLL